jgi:DNA-binding phage protein
MSKPVESLDDGNVSEWIEREAKALGVSVSRIAREAKIDRATFYRWKKGSCSPNLRSVTQVRRTIDSIWIKKGEHL